MRGSLLLTFMLTALSCCCQDLSYRQFTVKDGLPGAIVYQSLQDRNGFIWFATNQGVSRFDGRTFRNFSKEDGLPGNEIIKLYLDKYNNVWFISMMGIPSVFYHNSIIRIDGCTGVRSICEDAFSDDIIMVKVVTANNAFGYYRSVGKPGQWTFVFHSCDIGAIKDFFVLRCSAAEKMNVYFSGIRNDSFQTMIVQSPNKECHYRVRANTWQAWLSFGWPQYSYLSSDREGIFLVSSDSLYYADIHQMRTLFSLKDAGLDETQYNNINSLFSENDSTLWVCSRDKGLLRVRHPLGPHRSIQVYFPKSFCTSLIKDREGGYWITTHSDGVYYLPNLSFYSISGLPDRVAKSVLCIGMRDSHTLAAGFSDGNIMVVDDRRLNSSKLPGWVVRKNNRITSLGIFAKHELLVGTDAGLYRLQEDGRWRMVIHSAIKECYVPSDSTIVVANQDGIGVVTALGQLKAKQDMTRATCVTGRNEHYYYWGSLQGLYLTTGDSTSDLGEKHPALSGIINHIDIAPDSAIWVCTGEGIVILKDGRISQLTREQGLPSNLCKHISFDGSTCWVSTDKGICRIDYRWEKGRLIHTPSSITEEDGLTASDVNQTVAGGKYIWAATARGISFFSKDYISHSPWRPLINITRIVAGDSALALKDTLSLGPQKTRLLIELSGISFRSGKGISYEYRLKGTDTAWNHITNNSIEFPALPFGNYTLEVRAIDRWGKRSDSPRSIFIRHAPPFWLTTWFILSSYLLLASAAGAGVYIFHRHRRQKREKEYQLNKKMQDLEMMALRAQMNPHFIFNCLSSIQYHIMNADVKNASAYLHKFSTLIRQTLQNSTAPMILLRDEIQLLQLYLDLEKLRLGDRMEYHIDLSPELDPGQLLIPPMIVQPYVENAVKHGISPLQGVRGMLLVGFKKANNIICCTIEDNGPGMAAPGHNASGEEGHRSMGRSITEKRIQTFNALQKEKIRILITDKRLAGYATNGTLVQLFFPLSST